MPDYDAVVIGAGNGGLTAALTLARAGRKVLLLKGTMSRAGAPRALSGAGSSSR